MPTDYPGSGDVHVDALLTNLSIGRKNPAYIAEEIFPMVLVNKRSDILPQYVKSDWFRLRAKALGEREPAPVGGYSVSKTATYYCTEYGAAHFIGDARRANTDMPFDADRDGVNWLVDGMLLQKEYQWVSDFWKTGVWATDKTGGADFTKWSTYATSTPVQNIRAYKRTIARATGMEPNTLVLGDLTFDTLCDHPDFLDRIKYSGDASRPAVVTSEAMAAVLGVERVLVGRSQYTATLEGVAEASVSYTAMWDDDALLLYVPRSPSLFNPAAGYTFVWRTAFGGPRYVKRRRDPQSDKGDLLEMYEYFDQKATATDAGLFMSDAVD